MPAEFITAVVTALIKKLHTLISDMSRTVGPKGIENRKIKTNVGGNSTIACVRPEIQILKKAINQTVKKYCIISLIPP